MPRLFSAIELPDDVKGQLAGLPDHLAGARFLDIDALHLTLRFFGEVDRHVTREIMDGLAAVDCDPFELRITGLGVFGGEQPRTLVATIEASKALFELQSRHERVARSAGLPPESRKFSPHVSIARLKGTRPAAVADYISGAGLFAPLAFPVEAFLVMSAKPLTGGGPYRVEADFPLVPYDEADFDGLEERPDAEDH